MVDRSSADHWNERYRAADYFYGTEANDFLKQQVHRLPPGGAVLCLAEGEGRNAVYLATLGFQVTAVDISPVGLEKARKLAASQEVSIETIVSDLADYRFGDRAWDAIVSIWCHLPTTLRTRVYRDVARALRPGGVLIHESYTPAQIALGTGGPKDPDLLPTLEHLRRELSPLRVDLGIERERDIHEGARHRGRSAVVQVIAVSEET
jgi:SAM-dependent methyltransferase